MRVSCPSCQTNYNIDDKRIPPGGAKLKCSKCQTLFPIKAGGPAEAAGAVPLPGAGAQPGAIPLPGSAPAAGGAGAVPLPGISAAAPAAIPLPGLSAAVPSNTAIGGTGDPFAFGDGPQPGERWDEESTRVATVPLPSEAFRDPGAAIPMPGPEPVTGTYPKAETPAELFSQADSVPLPGMGGAIAPPPPMPFDDPPAAEEATRVASIPLPGAATPPADGGFDFDFAEAPPAPAAQGYDSIPLPGAEAAPAGYDSIPLPGAPGDAAPSGFDSIPLPGDAGAAGAVPLPGQEDFAVDFTDAPPAAAGSAIPLPGDPSAIAPPPPESFDFAAAEPAPPPAAVPDLSMDFAEPPPPAPAPAAAFDFADLPAPADAPPPPSDDFAMDASAPPPAPAGGDFSLDFADLPSPAGAPAPAAPPPAAGGDFSLDFSELPSPAGAPPPAAPEPSGDFSLDFADLPQPSAPPQMGAPIDNLPSPGDAYTNAPDPAPPAPVDVSASFGEVDFGDPSPAPSSGGDDLEFDPMGAPKSGGDDFEADLSAPLPPPKPAAAADGLEMLSFIDDTAKSEKGAKAGPKKRFHIRRRSGKTFGPFEEGVIVKMLEDGQLLGNEDVSENADAWTAIGTVPAFQTAIQKLMESPTAGAAAMPAPAEETQRTESTAEAMERLKQLYEGRMAAVTVVDKRADEMKFKRRLPFLIGGAVLLVLLAAGGALGLTRYGVFGLKLLLPAKVAAGSPQFTQLQKAREALADDTFKSYSEARDTAQAILKVKEFPEVRAVWCQAIFYLDRRYAAAKPGELNTARRELENIRLLGEKHPEVVKALAGDALAANRPDEARLLLEDAVVRSPKDAELKLLLAEAFVARNNADRAIQTLEQVLKQNETSAKALHKLGRLYQAKAETFRNAGKNEESKKAALQAQELFEKALAADPEHVISAVELAAIQLLVDRDVEAGTEALQKALDEKSKALMGPAEIARARALNGAALAMKFQVKEAVEEFEQAVKLDPASVFAKAQLGRIYIQQREYAKAVPLLKEASQKEPSNLDYVEGYLTVLIGSGKMQDALSVLQTANGQFPDTPRIAYLDARVNDALDNTKKAEDNYLRAIKGDPTLAEANLHLARLYLRLKRLPEARTQLESALEKAPQSAEVNAGMGELLLGEDKLDEANAAFLKAAELDPTLPDAQLGLSTAALRQGRVDDAEKAITRALELDPNLKGGYLEKGLVLFAQGKLDDAIAALEQAKTNEPSNAKINIHIGEVKLAKNDLAGAEASLLAALTQEPRNYEANFFLARVKSKRAEHTQAIENMRLALDANPDDPVYHYYMGLIFRDAKKTTEAMAEWKEAIKLDPQFADAMEALGQAHLERGEFDLAIGEFKAALAVDPSRARLYGAIGDAHFVAEEWAEAIKSFRQALQADNSLTYVYYKIGRALEQSGKARDAIDWYKKATEVEPDNPSPWYYLAFLQKQRSKRNEAIAAFKSYLKRRPDAPDKREIEDEIYDLEHGN